MAKTSTKTAIAADPGKAGVNAQIARIEFQMKQIALWKESCHNTYNQNKVNAKAAFDNQMKVIENNYQHELVDVDKRLSDYEKELKNLKK